MAEISTGHVVSDLPDLTGVLLADLPAMSVPHEDTVLDRITDNPSTEHSDQQVMPV